MDNFNHIVAWISHTGMFLPNVDKSPKFATLRENALLLADEQVDTLYPFLPNKITTIPRKKWHGAVWGVCITA